MLLVKKGGMFIPAFTDDIEVAKSIKQGKAFRADLTRVSPRSLKMMKLYFGVLLELVMDYWEPAGGLITDSERSILRQYNRRLGKMGGNEEVLNGVCETFLEELTEYRSHQTHSPSKSKEALHHEVVVAAGYYDVVYTASGGIRKVPRSINFQSMTQEEFNIFYPAAYGVVWNIVMKHHFKTKQEFDNALNQLLSMGR